MENGEFYSLVAQVLPVLFLALIVENRSRGGTRYIRGRLAKLIILSFFIGEGICLTAVFERHDPFGFRLAPFVVALCVIANLGFLAGTMMLVEEKREGSSVSDG